MSDNQLRRRVEDELEWESSTDASRIGVSAHDSVVTLTGYVPSYREKRTIERVAQRVRGVEAIANDIQVRMPGASERTDTEIARAACDVLKWAVTDSPDRIKISVSKGWVYLEGDLDREDQKTAAEGAVRGLAGVQGVINQIVVMSPATPFAPRS